MDFARLIIGLLAALVYWVIDHIGPYAKQMSGCLLSIFFLLGGSAMLVMLVVFHDFLRDL